MNTPKKRYLFWRMMGILIGMAACALVVAFISHAPGEVSAHPKDAVAQQRGAVAQQRGAVAQQRGAVAHPSDTYGPACGAATVDGVVNPKEWISAAVQTFQMIPGGGQDPFTDTLYIMNSGYNLYMGITINDDEFSTHGTYQPKGDFFRIDFDNDHSGMLFTLNDDVLYHTAGSPQFEDWFILGTPEPSYPGFDTEYGGTADGSGAASRVGRLNHFELRHPLCSGDERDFCLHPADIVGFRLEYMDAEADGSTGGAQFYPAFSDTAIADIVMAACPAADEFIYLPLLQK